MEFIPVVHAEISTAGQGEFDASDQHGQCGTQNRFHTLGKNLHSLIFRLIDRGDQIAYRLAAEEDCVAGQRCLQSFLPMGFLDKLVTAIVLLVTLFYALVG